MCKVWVKSQNITFPSELLKLCHAQLLGSPFSETSVEPRHDGLQSDLRCGSADEGLVKSLRMKPTWFLDVFRCIQPTLPKLYVANRRTQIIADPYSRSFSCSRPHEKPKYEAFPDTFVTEMDCITMEGTPNQWIQSDMVCLWLFPEVFEGSSYSKTRPYELYGQIGDVLKRPLVGD